jgi:hypothetical protein
MLGRKKDIQWSSFNNLCQCHDPPQKKQLWYAQIFLLLCELETFTELLKALQAM